MVEKEVELKIIRVRAFCECGGEFKQIGFPYASNPPQYPHTCNKCGMQNVFNKIYPAIECREVE